MARKSSSIHDDLRAPVAVGAVRRQSDRRAASPWQQSTGETRVRRLFTTSEALFAGLTESELRWGARQGRWRRLASGIWAEGPAEPSPLEHALGVVKATGGVASGHLAGVLHGYDSVQL